MQRIENKKKLIYLIENIGTQWLHYFDDELSERINETLGILLSTALTKD